MKTGAAKLVATLAPGAVALQAEAHETVDAVCEFAGEDVLVIAPDDPLRGGGAAGSEIAGLAAGGVPLASMIQTSPPVTP